MKSVLKHSALSFIAGIFVFSSCKVAKPVDMPAVKTLPDSFPATKDTVSIASIAWHNFFTDKYLTALIDSALKNNPDLFIALQRIEMAKAQVTISKGALLPSLNAVVSGAVDKYGDYTMNGVGNYDTNLSQNINSKQKIPTSLTPDLFIGFRSNWEIDIWGKLKNEKQAAIAQLLATEKGRQFAVTAVVAEVANLYYELLALDNELNIIRKNVSLQEAALDVVKVQKEGGRATELAVQQFAAQLLNTKAIEFSVKQEIVGVIVSSRFRVQSSKVAVLN